VPRGTRDPAHGRPLPFAYGAVTPSGRPSQVVRLNSGLCRGGSAQPPGRIPQPHRRNACRLTRRWFGLFPLRSPLLGESRLISCPPATEMFQFTGWPPACLCVQQAVAGLHPAGFPHSDIPGSKPVCGSPRLFAACHVLRRPKAPRHPPHALVPLTAPESIQLPKAAQARVSSLHQTLRGYRRAAPVKTDTSLDFLPSAIAKVQSHLRAARIGCERLCNRAQSARPLLAPEQRIGREDEAMAIDLGVLYRSRCGRAGTP
jgi:hypothetical protein